MKILVTGGAGFIGSHTVDALIDKGYDVRILDILQPTVHPKGKPDHVHPKAEFIQGDASDKAVMEQALDGVSAVYHFAAYQDYLNDFSTFFAVNAVSTALLYEILVENKRGGSMKKVVVAASQAVMGEGRYACPACDPRETTLFYPDIRTEARLSRGLWEHECPDCGEPLKWRASDETVVNPWNQYAISKHCQEEIALKLGRRYDIPTAVMRYSIVQGPRQSFYNAYSGAMRIFSLSLRLAKTPVIFEDGLQVRDFVNIADVVDANLLVLDHPEAVDAVFNVGGGAAWTVTDFYRAMERVTGMEMEPDLSGKYRYGDTRHIFSDTGRLQALGWRPRFTVEDSIASYWEYIGRQKDMADILEYAQRHMADQGVIRKKNP